MPLYILDFVTSDVGLSFTLEQFLSTTPFVFRIEPSVMQRVSWIFGLGHTN